MANLTSGSVGLLSIDAYMQSRSSINGATSDVVDASLASNFLK